MTFSYNDSLSTDKDKVRQLLGDIDQDDALVSDEAIKNFVAQYGNIYFAAAALADGIATKFARMPSMSFSGLSLQGADRAQQYRELAISLRNQATVSAPGGIGIPEVTGVSQSAMQIVETDTDRDPNRFKVGQDDFPGTEIPRVPPDLVE